jgi:Domain of unknown function (DUF4939)
MTRSHLVQEASIASLASLASRPAEATTQNVDAAPDPEILQEALSATPVATPLTRTAQSPSPEPISLAELAAEVRLLREENVRLYRQLESSLAPRISLSVEPMTVAQPHPREPRVVDPEMFTGRVTELEMFLIQCDIVFRLNVSRFPNDEAKVLYTIRRLSEEALKWALPIGMDYHHPLRNDHLAFVAEL